MPQIVVDEAADAAYVYIGTREEKREFGRTEPLLNESNGMVNLDFDVDGHLIGIELIPASHFLRSQDR
ncbi:DUF2283 domain-containing protein [Leifsonia sp. EB41]|uniref:DUF2283 domain-containing protein n=1 Tax=Leifsonia sp. EB41 TaxID=3156260 RepID=UPI003516DE8A